MIRLALTAKVETTIKNLLYNNWALVSGTDSPSQSDIGSDRFIVGGRNPKLLSPYVCVRIDRAVPKDIAGGTAPPTFVRHYVWIECHSRTDTELFNMEQECLLILDANRGAPGGGIHHLEYGGAFTPLSHQDRVSANIATQLRICAFYWR